MWDLLEGVPGLAGILPYVVAIYGVVAWIVLERPGIGPLRVKNGTGYRQGCVLAALLFCLVLHVTLLDVAARNPSLYISASVDDTKFLGDVATVPTALGTHAGLYALMTRGAMNLDKYEVYSPTVPLDEVRAALDLAELPSDMAV